MQMLSAIFHTLFFRDILVKFKVAGGQLIPILNCIKNS